jgi:L-asparagine transporter-like permease
MSVTGLFATAGATNGGLYPAAGLCEQLAKGGQFPPLMGRRLGNRLPVGLLITAAGAVLLAVGFSLTAIASIGSAAALLIFTMVTVGHLRVRTQTGARTAVLILGIVTTGLAFLTFVFTTLVTEPVSAIALILILLLSAGLDVGWKRRRSRLASGEVS